MKISILEPLLLLASFSSSVALTDIRGKIKWTNACPGISSLGPSKVYLDNGVKYGGVLRDGTFLIPDVSPGTYILRVDSHDHPFEQLRIDVHDDGSVPEVRPYVTGTPLNPPASILLPYPVTLVAKERNVYFVPPQSFNVLGMLRNPMTLLMIFAGAMMLGMPYLMKNMDPESLEEFKEQQAKVANMQNAMASGDFRSGFSALLSGGEESPGPATPPKSQVANTKGKGGKAKRR